MSDNFGNMINFTIGMPFTFKISNGVYEETKVLPLCISIDGLRECNEKQQQIVRKEIEKFLETLFNNTKKQKRLSDDATHVLLKYLGYSEEKVIYFTINVGMFKNVKVYMCIANLQDKDKMPHILVKHHMKIKRGDILARLVNTDGIIKEK